MNETLTKSVRDLIYLTTCALHNQKPDLALLGDTDWNALYKLAKRHSMTAVVCMALESGGALGKMEPELAKKWTDEKNKSIRKTMLMDAELCKIVDFMEENGIWYMPLKGLVIKDLYPRCGMRQMADYDILFDPAGQEKLREFMAGQGYERKSSASAVHDAYYKPPVYNFELHQGLFGDYHSPVWYEYYKDVKQRLIPDGGLCCRFRDEDFYVYITAHACKHYKNAGTGLRSLMDCYVYCQARGNILDWDYIRSELAKLGLAEFEKMSNGLAFLLFSEPDVDFMDKLTVKQREAFEYFTGSGTYGTMAHRVEKQLHTMQSGEGEVSVNVSVSVSKRTRLRYLLRRLFPDMEWFRGNAPFCYRHRWAVPFYVVWRAIRGAVCKRKRIWREIQTVRKVK